MKTDETLWVAYNVFIKLYDGDVEKWMLWLRTNGSDEQVASDFPIALFIKKQIAADPKFVSRLRKAVS